MSIVKNNLLSKKGSYLSRFSLLAKTGIFVFHTADLASLWKIENKHNLHMTLKRYADRGLLFRVYRGLYSLRPAAQLNSLLLGVKALHRHSYVSAETVLAAAGIIQQKINQITLISSISKKFTVAGNNYYCRKLADKFLYNNIGIIEDAGMKRAIAERAVADLLYYNPKAYFDAEKQIDWKKVKQIQKAVGYPLTFNRYKNNL